MDKRKLKEVLSELSDCSDAPTTRRQLRFVINALLKDEKDYPSKEVVKTWLKQAESTAAPTYTLFTQDFIRLCKGYLKNTWNLTD